MAMATVIDAPVAPIVPQLYWYGPAPATMLTVAVLADLLTPIPKTVRQGQWITVDAVLHDGAVEGRVVVLGPRGLPRVIPSSFDPATARVVARFMADRQGDWLLQVVGTTDAGPKPMLEAQVRVGPRQAVTHVPVPGEAAGHGLSDEQAMVAKLNAARVEEGLLPLVVDAQLTALSRLHHRAHLQAEDFWPVERHADRTPAKRRIFLPRLTQVRQDFICPDIKRAENHRLAIGLIENSLVVAHLRGKARESAGHHEMQFGAVKADAVGA